MKRSPKAEVAVRKFAGLSYVEKNNEKFRQQAKHDYPELNTSVFEQKNIYDNSRAKSAGKTPQKQIIRRH